MVKHLVIMVQVFSVCLLLCSFDSAAISAQPKVVKMKTGEKTLYIGGFVELNHTYVSLTDLSECLGLRSSYLESTGKLYVYSEYGGLLFSPNNNFIVVFDSSGSKVYQLPLSILSANGKLYIPIDFVSEYFSRILRGALSYDEASAELSYSESTRSKILRPSIANVKAEEKANGAVVEISMQELPTACDASIGPDNTLYVTIMPAVGNIRQLNSLPPNDVYSDILAIQNPNSVQLSFKLKQRYDSRQVFIDSSSNSVVIALYLQRDAKRVVEEEIRKKLEDEKKNWKLNVVVIDPGHGGEDPGAIGVRGTMEKNVTLAIARDLKRDINENLPGVKVVMTREDDEFVGLDERGEIANKVGGKLFISIHCNSMPHKPNPANGLETYFLRPGRTEEAIRIAAQENAAIKYENDYERKYQAYDEDNVILTTMAHSAYVKYSERLAQLIEDDVSSVASLADNGVSQAGFYVLVGASMPAVLVETGYLSNPKEERYLRSKSGQEAIARGIANAILKFKNEYEENFTQN
jgi:N-acetylmuramoyl-L-alanine amidase